MPQVSMDQFTFTRIAAATMSAYARVKLDTAGKVVLAGLTDNAVGFLDHKGATDTKACTVVSINAPSLTCIAVEAVEVGDLIYSAASGKVADTDGGSAKVIGQCLDVGTADGHIVRVLPAR